MKHISFKQYYEAKELLKKAGVENITHTIEYTVTKYCKIPVLESYDKEKLYLSLKPTDVVKILWEFEKTTPILKKFVVITDTNKEYIPCWTSNKMQDWTGTKCKQIKSNNLTLKNK
ncbi:hypothetical protein Xoosp13_255 [Xanthomonas phage Xoo-sp13]|nr:hypothetical protein Xoosp13_255 [Xanthomonas phage Xoo-sp13]